VDRARARCTAGYLLVAWGCTSFGAAFAETPRPAAVAAVGAPLDSVSASIVDLTNVERDRAGIHHVLNT